MAPTPLARLEGLSVRRGRRDVVRGVDLTLERGEVVAVLGPNGAGKSTLLEALGGVVPTSGGALHVEGRVATVLQTPGLARRSVRANVELALAWWGVPRRRRRARAAEALEQMRAGHLARRPAGALSGGERRRVHVARGLACRPDLLLLDEPFAGLDPETRAGLTEDTASALRTSAGGVLVVVHERAEAWALADRLVVMLDGRVAASGTPRELLAAPPSAEVARFLGYDGELAEGDDVLLTRASHVGVDASGDLEGRVTRVLPQQDGVRVEVLTPRGTVRADHPEPGLSVGDDVRLRVRGERGSRPYSEAMADYLRIGEVAAAVGVSVDTLRRWEADGRVTFERHHNQRVLPAEQLAGLIASSADKPRTSSARNRFVGVVVSVQRDGIMAQVELACGDFRVVSLMSREAADDLGLEPGKRATAVVKATTVIVEA